MPLFCGSQPGTELETQDLGRTVCDVILHACLRIDLEFLRIYRPSQSVVIFPGVLSLGISFGVVNVLRRQIAAQALLGDFKLGCGVTVGLPVSDESDFGFIIQLLTKNPSTIQTFMMVCRLVLDSPATSTA